MMTIHYTYKMLIAYDGTSYMGWQIQKNAITVQQLIQEALSKALKIQIHAIGAGRTDTGVHALGQCAHFHTPVPIDTYRLCGSLNGLLPPQIRIHSIEQVPNEFHARYSAINKFYRYHLTLKRHANPTTRLYSWHLPMTYDLKAAEEATQHFIGTHDFTSFANIGSHLRGDAVRSIHRLESIPTEDGLCYEFEGPGFLYKMVRNIVNTLVAVGTGKINGDKIPNLIAARDRRATGDPAPAHGLFLVRIDYPKT